MAYGRFRRRRRFPVRRRFRRRIRRRFSRTRRSRRRVRRRGVIRTLPRVLPDTLRVKFRYSETYQHTGTAYSAWFRGNGPRDPQVSLGGGSCYNYVQLMSLYRYYICHASRIRVDFIQNSNITTAHFVAWLFPTRNASTIPPANIRPLSEVPYVKWKDVMTLPAARPTTLTNYFTTRRLYSVTNIRDSEAFRALYTGEPANQWFWTIQLNQSYDSTTPIAVIFRVTIDYYCDLTDRVLFNPDLSTPVVIEEPPVDP